MTRPWLPVALAAAVIVSTGACGRHEFPDRTARVTVDGHTTVFEVDSCGRDGRTVFVVGKAPGGLVLQAVVGVAEDHRTGVLSRSGLTVTTSSGWTGVAPNRAVIRNTEMGAFGPASWKLRGVDGRAPGRITSARVRGSRIQVAGEAEPLDAEGRPSDAAGRSAQSVALELDARCDETDET